MPRPVTFRVLTAAAKVPNGEARKLEDGTVLRREDNIIHVTYPDGETTFISEGGCWSERKEHRRK